MQLLKTIKNYHPIGNMKQHFIRLQKEGTASRCGGYLQIYKQWQSAIMA
jgi:aerobic-type carbon monoxide dehydrogenase small subunit (CoxS/CutS family)